MVSGILDAALEISERRAAIQREMKAALLKGDLESVLHCACSLTGVEESRVDMLRSIPQDFFRITEKSGSRLSTI